MLTDDSERLALGEAWYRLAVRADDAAALESAGKTVDRIIAKPQASAQATLLRAMIADRAGDSKTAEINYRRTLSLSPINPKPSTISRTSCSSAAGMFRKRKPWRAKPRPRIRALQAIMTRWHACSANAVSETRRLHRSKKPLHYSQKTSRPLSAWQRRFSMPASAIPHSR